MVGLAELDPPYGLTWIIARIDGEMMVGLAELDPPYGS